MSDFISEEEYNISVRNVGEREFFGEIPSRIPETISEEIITYEFSDDHPVEDSSDEFLSYLDLASTDNFARELLRRSGFEKPSRLLMVGNEIPFGITSTLRTNVCIVNRRLESIFLVVGMRVIEKAIATFQHNNKNRGLDKMIIPCITITGTFPTFCLVPVTKELSDCVMTGQHPINTTEVLVHAPDVPEKSMKPIDSRKKILQCYESFKKFVDELEEQLGRE
jgi:hypothetical protein